MRITEPGLSLAERVAARVDQLSPSELEVATFISQHLEDVALVYEQGPLEAAVVLAEAAARELPVVLLTDTWRRVLRTRSLWR